jgi:hypothetical protein
MIPNCMKNLLSLSTDSYLRLLLLVPALCLLEFTGCSSIDAGTATGKEARAALIEKMDPPSNQDDDVVAANRNWYQLID